jgi:hypothetical protein
VFPAFGGLVGEGDGTPHFVWYEQAAPTSTVPNTATWALRHARLDAASGWVVEEVERHASPFHPAAAAAIEPGGTLHLLTADAYGGPLHWSNAGGAWASEPAGTETGYRGDGPLRLDPQGQPAFLGLSNGGAISLQIRAADGWHSSPFPLGYSDLNYPVLALLVPGAGHALALYSDRQVGSGLSALERTATGGWKTPQHGMLPAAPSELLTAAASADGARLVVASDNAAYPALILRDGDVWGTPLPLNPGPTGLAAGFTPAGKAWVLDGVGGPRGDCTATGDYALWEEL